MGYESGSSVSTRMRFSPESTDDLLEEKRIKKRRKFDTDSSLHSRQEYPISNSDLVARRNKLLRK